jgi:D-tyrosyl-tRNA(Tyr) deacylase
MRAVIQRVKSAEVRVGGEVKGSVGKGALVLLGVEGGDSVKDAEYLASKVAHLRIFEDPDGKMNLSLMDTGGEMLVVSQFTLLADCRKGRRPSFVNAAEPEDASKLYREFVQLARSEGVPVATGEFQARMEVGLVNDGPVTILLDSKKSF